MTTQATTQTSPAPSPSTRYAVAYRGKKDRINYWIGGTSFQGVFSADVPTFASPVEARVVYALRGGVEVEGLILRPVRAA